jgi:predicted AAA+ superfamily ATPase
MTQYISRKIESLIIGTLNRGKSILLLGARQTGKTTMILQHIKPDICYSFVRASDRQRYEQNSALLEAELEARIQSFPQMPIVFIDEVQKIPAVMDIVQHCIDRKLAQFVLTGSSARRLKRGPNVNLLPGRVVVLHMTPFLFAEIENEQVSLESLLLYGTLPGIFLENNSEAREQDLYSYVEGYLEEEIRAEALVRNVGNFALFLEFASGESGKQLNMSQLSQNIGISSSTVAEYFQILDDCMVARRVDPLTRTQTKRRLIKSPKYLFFDLGVRRACAKEGSKLSLKVMSDLFEQYVGNELLNTIEIHSKQIRLRYWRDSAGPEVDYVIEAPDHLIPVEVRWSDKPTKSDARHLIKFLAEYPEAKQAFVVCRTPTRYQLAENIIALPWQELSGLIEG